MSTPVTNSGWNHPSQVATGPPARNKDPAAIVIILSERRHYLASNVGTPCSHLTWGSSRGRADLGRIASGGMAYARNLDPLLDAV